ncbi:MAG: hypothetical protein GX344_04445 [Intrasporangiaceae bacterium]|nr:hypothetical protein [Intrasporangiaceae bacterium]
MSLWRRHRASLLGIPVALAVALLASGERIGGTWDVAGPRDPAAISTDGWAVIHGQALDGEQVRTVPLEVRLDRMHQVEGYARTVSEEPLPVSLPAGSVMWQAQLSFRADRTHPVQLCRIRVSDTEGRHYLPGLRAVENGDLDGSPCLLPDRPGPRGFGEQPEEFEFLRERPRPLSWSRYVTFVMPADRQPETVEVWFQFPEAAVFPVEDSSGR